MVISRVFNRTIYAVSLPNRTTFLGNAPCKRPFLRKTENFVPVINARNYRGYEGDGKTVATLINSRHSYELYISKYTAEGFILPNKSHLIGSIMIFPHTVMHWNVSEAKDVTEESLVLFKLLEPKIDLLVFGYGNRKDFPPEVRENFAKCCKKLGLRYEALPTEQAVGTFNFLAEERRLVAGALIPPRFIDALRFDRSPRLLLEEGDEEDEQELIDDGAPNKKLIK